MTKETRFSERSLAEQTRRKIVDPRRFGPGPRVPFYPREPSMKDLLFWLCSVSAVTLIVHEIGSAYWKEWDLFCLRGGAASFLLLHLPLLFLVM
jgi:hypothetical protein